MYKCKINFGGKLKSSVNFYTVRDITNLAKKITELKQVNHNKNWNWNKNKKKKFIIYNEKISTVTCTSYFFKLKFFLEDDLVIEIFEHYSSLQYFFETKSCRFLSQPMQIEMLQCTYVQNLIKDEVACLSYCKRRFHLKVRKLF